MTPAALWRVPRLDPGVTGELLSWRERLKKTFLFDPDAGADRADTRALVHKYQPQMRPVERELVQGIGRLSRIQQDVMRKRVVLRPSLEKRAQELAQATADYRVFGSFVEDAVRQDVRSILSSRLFSR